MFAAIITLEQAEIHIKQIMLSGAILNLKRKTKNAVALGKEDRKKRAFYSGRRIVLTNDEALSWTRGIPISEDDMIVIDELSRYRHFRSERYQAVRRICRKAGRIAAFSRLPFPRGMSEIWEEFYLLDEGKRLGSVKADFLERYFFVKRIWTDGHIKIYTEPKENAGKAIRC